MIDWSQPESIIRMDCCAVGIAYPSFITIRRQDQVCSGGGSGAGLRKPPTHFLEPPRPPVGFLFFDLLRLTPIKTDEG